jgi:heparin/heparan-sulfate lyase
VFLNLSGQPVRAALVVFDRVVSADPKFKKYWLLHSMEKPKIDGGAITLAPEQRGWRGKLVDTVLLPARAEVTPVGGPGKEFWVFGENFPNQPRGGNPKDFETGEWRVEVSPREASATDHFLNVMQIMDRDTAPQTVKRIEEGGAAGVFLAGTTVLFQRDGRRTNGPVRFESAGNRFLVTDLAAGTWQVLRGGVMVKQSVSVSADDGVLWFEGAPGSYTLRR